MIKIQRQLVKSQEYGDEKLQLVGQMVDMVGQHRLVVHNPAVNRPVTCTVEGAIVIM